MKAAGLILLSVIVLAPRQAHGQSFHLTESALGSSGGVGDGASLKLGMTVGQAVTGIGVSVADPRFAETVGFWQWGSAPVLGVRPPNPKALVVRFALLPCTPNPFSRTTSIRYAIPNSAGPTRVNLRLFDLSGRRVRVLETGVREGGNHVVDWSGDDDQGHSVSGGIYFCRIDAGSFSAVRRIVIVR